MSEELNEIHIKSYDEWLKYYENATKEQVIEDLTQDVKYFADAVKDIKDLQNQLQQKENIIKEVREYHDNCVNNLLDLDKIDDNEKLAYKVAYEIHKNYLEILDKGE